MKKVGFGGTKFFTLFHVTHNEPKLQMLLKGHDLKGPWGLKWISNEDSETEWVKKVSAKWVY